MLIYNRFVKKQAYFLFYAGLDPCKWVCCNKPTFYFKEVWI